MRSTAASILAFSSVVACHAGPALAEPVQCIARDESQSANSGPAPGMLATQKDTPCRLSRHIAVKGQGSHQAGGIFIIKQPQNGKVDVESRSSFVFTPRKGFTGKDIIVARLNYGSGKGGVVRFEVTVD